MLDLTPNGWAHLVSNQGTSDCEFVPGGTCSPRFCESWQLPVSLVSVEVRVRSSFLSREKSKSRSFGREARVDPWRIESHLE